jgi:Malectin domain/Calcineurin-like phosphoesterase
MEVKDMRLTKALLFVAGFCAVLIASPRTQAQVGFPGPELLGRPEPYSITINVVANTAIQAYFQYGTTPGGENLTYPAAGASSPLSAVANQPLVAVISNLAADTQYYYRMIYRQSGMSSWNTRAEHSFHTARPAGEAFTFTVTADSHINIVFGNGPLFTQTMKNIASESPDFHVDLGDTFAMDNVTTQATANSNYLNIRTNYFSLISPSVPIFLAFGNHEQEEGWHLGDTNGVANSPPVLSTNARKQYYLNPNPDSFYTGNPDISSSGAAAVSGDHLLEDYYAWQWGDALFVVIDPYWYTPVKPYVGNEGGGEPDCPTGVSGCPANEQAADRWRWTLGVAQYQWLAQTLENSTAKYKFILAHQVAGGMDDYGRGGAYAVPYVEWGGNNVDGVTWAFDAQRTDTDPRWTVPIHQLLVNNHVTAFFHAHDHEYAHEQRDGVVYQLVPMAADATYGYGFNEYTQDGTYTLKVLPNSGHLMVTVDPVNGVTVQYVRAFISGAGTNGSIADSYTIPSANGTPAPASIAATAGTPQSAAINTPFTVALQATVKDGSGYPVNGAAVTFAAPISGASGTFNGSATVTTNSNGVATAPSFTANSISGNYTVMASVSGVSSMASFNLTNNPASTFTPIRINSGGPAYTDSLGQPWKADTAYTGGSSYTTTQTITNTSDPTLYKTSRYGTSFSYAINIPAGTYSVTLKFAEPVWAAKGKRVFNVAINGATVLSKFDIFAAAGAEFKAIDETFKVNSTGTIKIQFTTGSAGNPLVNAIQVVASP